jgi:sugar phosphate isomerase/epimerase
MAEDRIAGFGIATEGTSPDLAGLDEALARIEASGATFAELALYELDLIVAGRVLPERRRRLEKICAGRRLRYTVHGALSVNFMDHAHLDLHKSVCRAALELCDAIGAKVLVQHAGLVPARPIALLEHLHAMERAALAEMGDLAARYGVRIALENLFVESRSLYTAEPIRLAQQIDDIGHDYVVGTLDFSHAHLMATMCGLDFRAAVRALAPRAGHLHVHDSFGGPAFDGDFYTTSDRIAFGQGDLHLPMGWGDIPWDEILPGLPVRSGTVLMVELPRRFWSELDEVAASAQGFVRMINAREPQPAA